MQGTEGNSSAGSWCVICAIENSTKSSKCNDRGCPHTASALASTDSAAEQRIHAKNNSPLARRNDGGEKFMKNANFEIMNALVVPCA
jgi:hypothetical protein